MRYLIISIFLICWGVNSQAQAIIGKMYTIVPDYVNVYGVDTANKMNPKQKFRASSNTKFTVTGFDKQNNIKITFWRYYSSTSADSVGKKSGASGGRYGVDFKKLKSSEEIYNFDTSYGYIGQWANYKEFAIKPEDFNTACVAYYGTKNEFTWGVMTLPIKLRFGNTKDRYFNFEEKLNLGFVFGMRHQIQGKVQQAINYLAGVGIAGVRTDSLSLKNGKASASASASAFSTSIGALYVYGNFQVGLFGGFDYIPGAQGRDWRYQGKPWLGIAVGISLFSNTDTQGGKGENKSPDSN